MFLIHCVFLFALFTVICLNAINFLSLFILHSDWHKYLYVYLQTIRSKSVVFFFSFWVVIGNPYCIWVYVYVCVRNFCFVFDGFVADPMPTHHVFKYFRDFLSHSSTKMHIYHLLCCWCSMFHSVWSVHCILKTQNRYRSFCYLLLRLKLPDSAMPIKKQTNIEHRYI